VRYGSNGERLCYPAASQGERPCQEAGHEREGRAMLRTNRRGWITLLAAIGLLAACSQAGTPAAPASAPAGGGASPGGAPSAAGAAPAATQPPPLEEIKVAAVSGVNMSPYALALARGYYAEHGLDVSFLDIPAATGVKAAVAGEFQFVNAAGASIAAALNDAPVRVVFIASPAPLFFLYASPNITTLADLQGKRIGISSRGSSPEVMARLVLQRAQVDPDANITWVSIGSGTSRTQALMAGSVEAAVLSSPADVLARRAGFRELSSFPREFKSGGAAGTAAPVDFLRQRPDTARRWLEATIKGLRYMKADRAGSIPILAPYLEIDEDMMGDVYDTVIDFFTTDGLEDDEGMRVEIEQGKQSLGIENKQVAPDQVFDFTLTREAGRRVDASGWRP
jgi:NitT/TauT family transport system substrate-binding protein